MMVQVQSILDAIDEFAPWRTATEWDNSGLVIGSPHDSVEKVGIVLDVSGEALKEASSNGCDCIVSHHPLLFEPVRRIQTDESQGKMLAQILRSGINVIAAHTNWDVSRRGVNVILAELLKLEEIKPLGSDLSCDFQLWEGVSGNISTPLELKEFAIFAKKTLSLGWVHTLGRHEKVEKIALCGGSGGGLWKEALKQGADVFLTSDMKYHEIQDAVDCGLSIIIADHGEIERLSLPFLKKEIEIRTGLEVCVLKAHFDSGMMLV